jgi:hypothetical protein
MHKDRLVAGAAPHRNRAALVLAAVRRARAILGEVAAGGESKVGKVGARIRAEQRRSIFAQIGSTDIQSTN